MHAAALREPDRLPAPAEPPRNHLRLVPAPEKTRLAPGVPDLSQMFRRYSPYVAAIAARVLGHSGDVDDVVQDVFLAALTGMRLRDPDAVKSWLATVTVRTSRRMLRVRARERTHDDLECDEIAGPALAPEQAVELARVSALLQQLPADLAGAWLRRHVGGEPLGAVASSCECSLATAKRRISAAQVAIGRALTGA